jgi:hypothetical protein
MELLGLKRKYLVHLIFDEKAGSKVTLPSLVTLLKSNPL